MDLRLVGCVSVTSTVALQRLQNDQSEPSLQERQRTVLLGDSVPLRPRLDAARAAQALKWKRTLWRVEYRSKRPERVSDWELVYTAIKRTLEPDEE